MTLFNIIFSPTGGVKKVSDIISKELSESDVTIDLTKSNTNVYQLEQEDLAVISMPSFGGRVPQIASKRLRQVKANHTKAILICVYGNRAYEDTLVEMQDLAKELGFDVVAAISAVAEHSIVRNYGANRPDEKDCEQLKEFAKTIKERISHPDEVLLEIPGNRPYKKSGNTGLVPKTAKSCVNCKKCAELCPTEAISKTDIKKVDKNKCITCMRCVSICPHNAKNLSKVMTGIISLALKKVCSERKENELF